MLAYKYLAVAALVLSLVHPTGSFLEILWKPLERLFTDIAREGCKVLFGIACPIGLSVGGAVATGASGGVSAPVAAGLVATGVAACRVAEQNCKRSLRLNASMEMLPFSDDMSDYDYDEDERISYPEFFWGVVRSVPLLMNPDDLMKPFTYADKDDDGELDWEEFNEAPFLFSHIEDAISQTTTTKKPKA